MSLFLPPEILDLVAEHLYGERATLKICCLVSKSWVPRARRHLFARVEFHHDDSPVESWMKAFPDPANSPAHHVRSLRICSLPDLVAAATVAHAWIRTFSNIVKLIVETKPWDDNQTTLVSLHALSPVLKTLTLIHNSIPSSEVFNLICSFPSLEDLSLMSIGDRETDTSALPPISPKFTGALYLVMNRGIRLDVSRLLSLPGGLHFTRILVGCLEEDFESITGLVSACCGTLETFTVMQYFLDLGAPLISGPLDLSKATNLKKVVFQAAKSSVRWILMALQTVKSKNLQNISIHWEVGPYEISGVAGKFFLEWQDLDRLLVQFWTSHSIRPKLFDGTKRLVDLIPTLFPELTRRGLLDVV